MLRGALWLALCVVAFGCGPITPYAPPPGDTCYDDTDCMPNACCGKGDAIVFKTHAPDCTTVKCDGSCPPDGIKCGCAVPVCRNSRCTSAIATTTGC
jgi:hypothetical protein